MFGKVLIANRSRISACGLGILAVLLTCPASVSAQGHQKGFPYAPPERTNAKCSLAVNGHSYINGPCVYRVSKGGSFEFSDNKLQAFCYDKLNDCSMADLTITHNGYFGSLDVSEPKVGYGYWNEGVGLHGQSDLGTLYRNGACWMSGAAVHPQVKLCVWR